MAWAKFDDRRHASPKLQAVGLAASGLDANAITWCAQNETDGQLPAFALAAIAWGDPKAKRYAAQLVAVGRWTVTEIGWEIHDYLVYNRTHAQLEVDRAKTKERVTRHRNGVTGDVTNAVGNDRPLLSSPLVGISSSSVPVVAEPDDEDGWIEVEARKQLAARQAASGLGPVRDVAAWLVEARRRVADSPRPKLALVAPPREREPVAEPVGLAEALGHVEAARKAMRRTGSET